MSIIEAYLPDSEYVSMEQFRTKAHISKRKALALIQEGLVPAIDTQRKTWRYLIAKEDAEAYIEGRNDTIRTLEHKKNRRIRCVGCMVKADRTEAARMRKYVREKWNNLPDMMTAQMIADELGYHVSTIRRWLPKLNIKYVRHGKARVYSKNNVIKAISRKAIHGKAIKSRKHIELLKGAFDYEGK